jgi:hypothetical protein
MGRHGDGEIKSRKQKTEDSKNSNE